MRTTEKKKDLGSALEVHKERVEINHDTKRKNGWRFSLEIHKKIGGVEAGERKKRRKDGGSCLRYPNKEGGFAAREQKK